MPKASSLWWDGNTRWKKMHSNVTFLSLAAQRSQREAWLLKLPLDNPHRHRSGVEAVLCPANVYHSENWSKPWALGLCFVCFLWFTLFCGSHTSHTGCFQFLFPETQSSLHYPFGVSSIFLITGSRNKGKGISLLIQLLQFWTWAFFGQPHIFNKLYNHDEFLILPLLISHA